MLTGGEAGEGQNQRSTPTKADKFKWEKAKSIIFFENSMASVGALGNNL